MSSQNGWTPARRSKQSALIRQWKPWAYSTGPKTDEGKAIASRNAYRENSISRRLTEVEADLRLVNRWVRKFFAKRSRQPVAPARTTKQQVT